MTAHVHLVDSHVHLWDTTALQYPWLDELTRLRRPFLPEHLAEETAQLSAEGVTIDGIVHVQADVHPDHALDEVDLVTGLSSTIPVLGIVAYAPVEVGAAVQSTLDELTARPLVVGVRRSAQNEADGFLSSDGYVAGLVAVDRAGLSADLCVRARQLPELVGTLRRAQQGAPGLRTVLDHAGKPPVAEGGLAAWREDLAALAELPGVVCKLSGLLTEADWEHWTPEQVEPYVHAVVETFGPQRVMFGSDWPVLTLAGRYQDWLGLVRSAIAHLSPTDRDAVLRGTAARTYRLAPDTTPETDPQTDQPTEHHTDKEPSS